MSVHRKGGRWYPVVDHPRGPDGKRDQRWHGGYRTKKEALAAEVRIRAEIQKGSFVQAAKMTFEAYLRDVWLPAVQHTVRPTTFSSYSQCVDNYFAPVLGRLPLEAITGPTLNRLYSDLLIVGRPDTGIRRRGTTRRRPLSPATVRRVHAVAHRCLQDAVRWRMVPRNPASEADPPKAAMALGRKHKTGAAEEVARFLAHVRSDRLSAAFLLACTTGMRRGEVVGLHWEDVDLESSVLRVTRTLVTVGYSVMEAEPKTARGRRPVELDDWTVAALAAHREQQIVDRSMAGSSWVETGLVFTEPDGTALHPDWFTSAFKRHVAESGLPQIRFHDLRHSHATLALVAGVPPKVISDRLGHADPAFTLRTYTDVVPALGRDAADRVAGLPCLSG